MRTPTTFLSMGLAAALAAAGCGGEGAMMRDYAAGLGEHITALETEAGAHNVQVLGVPDLTRLPGIEGGHRSGMQDHMGQMQHMMTDMTLCLRGWGDRADARDFSADMGSMQREWEDHLAAMRAATDLPAARAEEARHQARMPGLFEPMRRHRMSMMDGAGSLACGMHGH